MISLFHSCQSHAIVLGRIGAAPPAPDGRVTAQSRRCCAVSCDPFRVFACCEAQQVKTHIVFAGSPRFAGRDALNTLFYYQIKVKMVKKLRFYFY